MVAENKIDNISEFPNDDGMDAGQKIELICGQYSCGNVIDKNTGTITYCGACDSVSQCDDNDIKNQCGNACMPLLNSNPETYGKYDTAGCNYYFGEGNGWAHGDVALQFPGACNYINVNNCIYIINSVAINQPCAGDVCNQWYCCASNPSIGTYALLPGAGDNYGSL